MRRVYSILIGAFLGGIFLTGCASVESTKEFYRPYTTKKFPPKPKDADIPIFGKPPREKYETLGRLAFASQRGYRFMMNSIRYNAREQGADAAILKNASTRRDTILQEVPPSIDWVPVENVTAYRNKKGQTVYGTTTNYIPFYRPGYVLPITEEWTAIDAELIRFTK